MKTIAISFTLKNQNFSDILNVLKEIRNQYKEEVILIHGFMSYEDVVKKGFKTDVVDALKSLFPVQLNMYNGKPLRTEMVDICKQLEATIYIIGDIVEGVLEEYNLYKEKNLEIITLNLDKH